MQNFVQRYLLFLIIIAALLLRLPEYFISLAYDEIWTLQNFAPLPVGKLLFDLELPNNHPLNSILVKFIAGFSLPPETVRLPNLLAALGSLLLVWHLVKKVWGKSAAYWSVFFLAMSVPHLVYSVQARGYSLQIFFLLLYAAALAECSKEKCQLYYPLAAVAGAVGAIITLPTSCIYLCAITLILWNISDWQKPRKRAVITVAISAGLALTYILCNLPGLLAARQWGEKIVSASGCCSFIGKTLYMLVSPLLLIFAAWGSIKVKKLWWSAAALLIMLFGSALFTNAGPPRVYLPLAVAAAMLCGIGAADLYGKIKAKYQMLVVLAAVLATFAAYQLQMPRWRFTNYFPVINQAQKLTPEVLVIYPASESYPVLWNSNGQAAEQYARQLNSGLQKLMLINSPGEITGGDENFSQQNANIPVKGEIIDFSGVKAAVYTLEPVVDRIEPDMPVIALTYSTSAVKALAGKENVLMLNIFFKNAPLPDGRCLTAASWYIKPGALNKYVTTGISSAAGDIRLYKIKTNQ